LAGHELSPLGVQGEDAVDIDLHLLVGGSLLEAGGVVTEGFEVDHGRW